MTDARVQRLLAIVDGVVTPAGFGPAQASSGDVGGQIASQRLDPKLSLFVLVRWREMAPGSELSVFAAAEEARDRFESDRPKYRRFAIGTMRLGNDTDPDWPGPELRRLIEEALARAGRTTILDLAYYSDI